MTARISTIVNGIAVLTEYFEHVESVSLAVTAGAGARDETKAQNGIAHMLEHMAFKGTGRRTSRQIAEAIEAVGGDLNAATSMETTSYQARVLKQDWPLAVDVLGDIITDPVFAEDELAMEKDVILQEIAAANDTPDDLVYELGQKKAFPDQAIGRAILGESEQVAGYCDRDLIVFRDQHYHGGKIVVSAAGKIDHDEFVDQVAEKLGGMKAGKKDGREAARFAGGLSIAEREHLDQTHILLSFPTVGYRDDDIYAIQVLSVILGGGMSSRLFQDVREARGLCYAIYSHVSAYEDKGMFSIYAGTAPDKVGELIEVASDSLLSMTKSCKMHELQRARNQIKAALLMSLESPAARADQIARQYLAFGKVREIAEIIAKIEAVSLEDIKRLVVSLMQPGLLSMSAVGDCRSLPDYNTVTGRFFSR